MIHARGVRKKPHTKINTPFYRSHNHKIKSHKNLGIDSDEFPLIKSQVLVFFIRVVLWFLGLYSSDFGVGVRLLTCTTSHGGWESQVK